VLPPDVEWIIPTFHPSVVSIMQYKPQFAFAVALARAVRAIKGTIQLEVVEFSKSPVFDSAESGDLVAVDIEGRDTVEAVGISTAQGTWTSLFTPEAREASKRILGDPNTIKVAHNISFDYPRLAKFGVAMKGSLFCTMQAANMLQPDLPKGLDKVVPLHLDVTKWKHLSEIDPDLYNASDVAHTRKVAIAQTKIMLAQGSWDLFFNKIMPAYRTLIGMTERGIRIDLERLHSWQIQLDEKQQIYRRQWNDTVGTVNWASVKQLHKLFYQDLQIPFKYNRDGKVTLDEEALGEIAVEYPKHAQLVETLIGLRSTGKMRSTYADVEFSEDGCVHPDYLPSSRDFVDQSGKKEMVSTLRLSSWIMTIPKESEARRLYVPHRPGMVIIKGDWDQIELRIDAAMANDKQMLKDLDSDLHARTAERLGISRDLAKRINYAICKGAGRKKLVLTLKEDGIFVTEPEAQQLINSWNLAYPDLAAFHDYIRDQVSSKRRIINRFGHVRPFYGGSRDGNKALGYSTQSNSACLTWCSFVPLDEAFTSLGGSLLINVHDEFVAEVPASKEKEGREAMFEIMNREYPQINTGFKVPVSVKAGPNWKDVT
jgi:DNA polymerase-1